MKDSVLHGQMTTHPQLQHHQLFHMAPALEATVPACRGGFQMASAFQEIREMPVVLKDPGSDLTCHLSGSRKRSRDDVLPAMPPTNSVIYGHLQPQQVLLQKQLMLQDVLSAESSRANQSAMTSTSGRPASLLTSRPSVVSQSNHTTNTNTNPTSSSSALMSLFHHHNLEVDALVRLHAESLRSSLEEAQKRQCRTTVAAFEQYAQRRVAEKQAELEAATKRNAELEERLRQYAAETHAWFSAAKNNEALVSGLQASLEQALLQNFNFGNNGGWDFGTAQDLSCSPPAAEEGYGDSEEEGVATTAAVKDAASADVFLPVPCAEATTSALVCVARNKTSTGSSFLCRRCAKSDATVLVIPCRHLCLCTSCEGYVQECPVCNHGKNASLQINLS